MWGKSLGVAFQRIGRGLLGSWCIVGPILLIFAHGELTVGPLVMVSIFVLGFYVIAVLKFRSQGLRFIKAVSKDTLLTFVFVGGGGAISGVVAAFGGPALLRIGGLMIILPIIGFWILEAKMKTRTRAILVSILIGLLLTVPKLVREFNIDLRPREVIKKEEEQVVENWRKFSQNWATLSDETKKERCNLYRLVASMRSDGRMFDAAEAELEGLIKKRCQEIDNAAAPVR